VKEGTIWNNKERREAVNREEQASLCHDGLSSDMTLTQCLDCSGYPYSTYSKFLPLLRKKMNSRYSIRSSLLEETEQ